MPREKELNFTPLKKKKKVEKDAYARVTKLGQLVLPQQTLLRIIGTDVNQFFVRLYCDEEKRALGFNFPNKLEQGDTSFKVVKPYKSKNGSAFATIGVKSFVNSIDKPKLPTGKLTIKIHKGSYIVPKIYYIVIPKQS